MSLNVLNLNFIRARGNVGRGATRFLGVGGAKGENRPYVGRKLFFLPPPLGGANVWYCPPHVGGGNIFLHLPNCTSVKDCDVQNQYIL